MVKMKEGKQQGQKGVEPEALHDLTTLDQSINRLIDQSIDQSID